MLPEVVRPAENRGTGDPAAWPGNRLKGMSFRIDKKTELASGARIRVSMGTLIADGRQRYCARTCS